MAITVIVSETLTTVSVDESALAVTLNQSDNPITVTTTSDLTLQAGSAGDITYTATGSLAGGNVQDALGDLADQFFRSNEAPSASTQNLSEGDFFYDLNDNQLKVYRETSSNVFQFVPLAQATGDMETVDAGSF